MAGVNDVAAVLLIRTGSITTMKLQKLVFYCQAWHLAFTGSPLFPEMIQAWERGPVVPELHRQHRGKYQVTSWPTGHPSHLSDVESQTVEWVVRKYGEFSAEALSRMTHQEIPWLVARGGAADDEKGSKPIPHDQMRAFYSRQCSDPEVAVAQLQDTLMKIAIGARTADDVIAGVIEQAKLA
jgi:uncharacterized phage-associated protein